MLKIIVNAYAMCPGMGSEQGMAWNWCSNLAKRCELYIITESEYKDKILSVVKKFHYGENINDAYLRDVIIIKKRLASLFSGDSETEHELSAP